MATGLSHDQVAEILRDLTSEKVLIRRQIDTLLACPRCRNVSTVLKLKCTNCGETSLRTGTVIEHIPCGYVDFSEKFYDEDRLRCPKCRKTMKALGVDYRKPGSYYRCQSCGEVTPVPARIAHCERCGKAYDLDELDEIEVYAYQLNPEKRGELDKLFLDLDDIASRLMEKNLFANSSVRVKGKSGEEHLFSLIIRDPDPSENDPTFVDIFTSDKLIDETRVLYFYTKCLDMESANNMFVAVPGLLPLAGALARSYKINIVETSRFEEIADKIFQAIKKFIEKETERSMSHGEEQLQITPK